MATCAAENYDTTRSHPFVVVAPLVLVFDRADHTLGQVVGCLQAADVAVAAEVRLPWIRLPRGSFVRFPQMKKGRVRLSSEGWLLCDHPDYGTLLAAGDAGEIGSFFASKAFEKPPMVKLAPSEKNDEEVEAGARSEEGASTKAQPAGGAAASARAADAQAQQPPQKPREQAQTPLGTLRQTPATARLEQPQQPQLHRQQSYPTSPPQRLQRQQPPPPQQRPQPQQQLQRPQQQQHQQPRPQQPQQPQRSGPQPQPKMPPKPATGAPARAAASHSARGVSTPSGGGGWGGGAAAAPVRRPVPADLDADSARALLAELLERYSAPDFVERCRALDATWASNPGTKQEDRLSALDKICDDAMRKVIPRYGFASSPTGCRDCKQAISTMSRFFPDVKESRTNLLRVVWRQFQNLHGPASPTPQQGRAQDGAGPQRSQSSPQLQPAPGRTEVVFWGICDIKYDSSLPPEDCVRVLELGDGRASRFSGHGSHIKESFDGGYFVSDTPLKRSIMVDNKKVTHDMFVRAGYIHLRPRTAVYPRRYTPALAKSLVQDLGLDSGDAAVLKLVNRARGAGVVVVTAETADGVLRRLLTPPEGSEMHAWLEGRTIGAHKACFGFADPLEEPCLHWWSNECPVFVAERCCHSTMVPMEPGSEDLFDGTLRVAFALRQPEAPGSDPPFQVHWLGGYWKLPRVASTGGGSEAGTPQDLHDRIVSSFNSAEKRTAPVQSDVLEHVYGVLTPALPKIFMNGGLQPDAVERIYKDEPLFRTFALARVGAAVRLSDMSKARMLLETARKGVAPPAKFSAEELPERSVLSYIERNLGVNCAVEGRWEEAGVHWRRAVRICAPNATAHYLEGCYHQVSRDYDQGAHCMKRSIALDPDFRSSYIGLSNCYLLHGAFELALEACDSCLHRFPEALGAQFNLGQAVYQILRQRPGSAGDVVDRKATAASYLELAQKGAPEYWRPDDDKVLQWFRATDEVARARMPLQPVHIWRVFGWRP